MAVALKEGTVFVKRKHELADLSKSLERVTPDAVELIAEAMADITVPRKERLRCAETLIDLRIRVADQISKDELTRQVAEIKAKGLSTPLTPDDGVKKPAPPRLDMNTIQQV